MIKRVLTAILGIPLLYFVISYGGVIFFISLLMLISMGLWEYSKSVNNSDTITINYILEIILGIGILFVFNYNSQLIILGIIACFVIIFMYEILNQNLNVLQGIYAFFGIMYIPLFLGHMLLIQSMEKGTLILWMVFIISFSTDTTAYLIGMPFGKHKLCPLISPKKSVEGAVAGVLGSIVITGLYGYIMNHFQLLDFPIYFYLILALIGSIVSQFGDLTASLIKRNFGVKDFGNLLPGHGGVLDRFDSIIFATPLVYYFTQLFINGVIF